jgi:hypothetical protein
MSKLLNAIKNTVGTTLTENGALTLDKSGSKVLDFYATGGALRTRTDADILNKFVEAFDEDALLALKTLFYLRDVRGGQGERKVFRVCIKWLAQNRPSAFLNNIENVVKFGRWDDLFEAFDTKSEAAMVQFVKEQLGADARATNDTKLSLLAKWMPSANTSSATTRKLARRFIKLFKVTPKKYRKTLTSLRARLNVVETLMSSNEWESVVFEHVPSKANLLYKKAFSKHEPARYTQFIKDVQSGTKKINSSTLFPYEVVRDVEKGAHDTTSKAALDALWQALPDYLKDNPHNGLVMPDVSGSMSGLPMQVSISLAIYFAQRNKGFFKDHFIEFSTNASLVRVRSSNIVDAWQELSRANWSMSTNLQAAFDTILDAATANRLSQEDLPSVLYIISDMEFNQACGSNMATNFEVIKRKYRAAGYTMPVVVFWNVDSRNDQSPVSKDENGTVLVSGCSPSIFSQVISGITVTPYDFMLETLNKERYDSVVLGTTSFENVPLRAFTIKKK